MKDRERCFHRKPALRKCTRKIGFRTLRGAICISALLSNSEILLERGQLLRCRARPRLPALEEGGVSI